MYELRAKVLISPKLRDANKMKAARDIAVRDMLLELATELEKYVKIETETTAGGDVILSGRIYIAMPNEVRRTVLKGIGPVGDVEVVEPIDPVPTFNPEKAASDRHVAKLLKVAVRKIQLGG